MFNKRALIGVASAVTAAAASSVAIASAAAGAPSTTLHLPTTLKLVTSPSGAIRVNGSHQIVSSLLTRPSSGRAIGSGVFSCIISAADNRVLVCKSAFALSGGVIMESETIDENAGTLKGHVTGGSGDFAHVSGTIDGNARADGGSNVTLVYSKTS